MRIELVREGNAVNGNKYGRIKKTLNVGYVVLLLHLCIVTA